MDVSYYIFSNGSLKRKDNNITIETFERKKDLKIELTRDIFLFGEVELNTKCLNFLGQNKVGIHFFNYYGFYTGSFYPKETDLSKINESELEEILYLLNSRPRKCLNYATPFEIILQEIKF